MIIIIERSGRVTATTDLWFWSVGNWCKMFVVSFSSALFRIMGWRGKNFPKLHRFSNVRHHFDRNS